MRARGFWSGTTVLLLHGFTRLGLSDSRHFPGSTGSTLLMTPAITARRLAVQVPNLFPFLFSAVGRRNVRAGNSSFADAASDGVAFPLFAIGHNSLEPPAPWTRNISITIKRGRAERSWRSYLAEPLVLRPSPEIPLTPGAVSQRRRDSPSDARAGRRVRLGTGYLSKLDRRCSLSTSLVFSFGTTAKHQR